MKLAILSLFKGMKILDAIEKFMERIVEYPFQQVNFDPVQIEIELKRYIEKECKTDVLGKTMINSSYTVKLNKEIYDQFGVFMDIFKKRLTQNLKGWIKEKNYILPDELEVGFFLEDLKKQVLTIRSPKNIKRRMSDNDEKEKAEAKLIFSKGGGIFTIKQSKTIIGREEECAMVLNDGSVSNKHAIIINSCNRFMIKDLGSKNGVWVNCQRTSRSLLFNGDRILVGNVEFIFQCAINRKVDA